MNNIRDTIIMALYNKYLLAIYHMTVYGTVLDAIQSDSPSRVYAVNMANNKHLKR